MEFPEYQGISYEQASKEGSRLVAEAYAIGHWFHLPERLSILRHIMVLQVDSEHRIVSLPPVMH